MKYLFTILIFSFSISPILSQDYKKDFEKAILLFNTLDKYKANINIKIYDDTKHSQPTFTQKGFIKKNGNQFYYKINHIILLINKKYSLIVDEQTKRVVCKKLKKKLKTNSYSKEVLPNVDEVFKNYKSVKLISNKNGVKHYRIIPKKDYKKVDVHLTKQGLVSKLEYISLADEAGVSSRMIFELKNSTITPSFSEKDFSENKFIVVSKDKITLASKYRKYRLTVTKDYKSK